MAVSLDTLLTKFALAWISQIVASYKVVLSSPTQPWKPNQCSFTPKQSLHVPPSQTHPNSPSGSSANSFRATQINHSSTFRHSLKPLKTPQHYVFPKTNYSYQLQQEQEQARICQLRSN